MREYIKQLENEIKGLRNDSMIHPSQKAVLIKEKTRTIKKLKSFLFHPEIEDLAKKMLNDGVINSYEVGVGVVILGGKKEVELVHGECYTYEFECGDELIRVDFRYDKDKQGDIRVLSSYSDKHGFQGSDFGVCAVECKDKCIPLKGGSKLIEAEKENNNFWDAEKGDFLKLKDVCCIPKSIDVAYDIYTACKKYKAHKWIKADVYYSVEGDSLLQTMTADGRTIVPVAVFLKLLK